MQKHKKNKGLIKQVTRFKMHKSGKFWVFSSTTHFSWLNLSKKSRQQVQVKLEQRDPYQQVYGEEEKGPWGRTLKVAGGLAAGLGLGALGGAVVETRASAQTEQGKTVKEAPQTVLAQQDSVGISLQGSESQEESSGTEAGSEERHIRVDSESLTPEDNQEPNWMQELGLTRGTTSWYYQGSVDGTNVSDGRFDGQTSIDFERETTLLHTGRGNSTPTTDDGVAAIYI